MTIISTTMILAPVEFVWEALMDPQISFEWLPNLESVEHFSGESGEVNSQNLLKYSEEKTDSKVIQKLLEEIPFKLIKVESKGRSTTSIVTYRFTQINTYTKLTVIAQLVPQTVIQQVFSYFTQFSLKRQMAKDFHQFKNLVEQKYQEK